MAAVADQDEEGGRRRLRGNLRQGVGDSPVRTLIEYANVGPSFEVPLWCLFFVLGGFGAFVLIAISGYSYFVGLGTMILLVEIESNATLRIDEQTNETLSVIDSAVINFGPWYVGVPVLFMIPLFYFGCLSLLKSMLEVKDEYFRDSGLPATRPEGERHIHVCAQASWARNAYRLWAVVSLIAIVCGILLAVSISQNGEVAGKISMFLGIIFFFSVPLAITSALTFSLCCIHGDCCRERLLRHMYPNIYDPDIIGFRMVYREWNLTPEEEASGDFPTDCAICLSELIPEDPEELVGEKIVQLPCSERHCFHADCIDEWTQRRKECPLCKTKIPTEIVRHERKKKGKK